MRGGFERHKHLLLLAAVLLALVTQPLVAHASTAARFVYDLLLGVAAVGVLLVVFMDPWERRLALVLAVPAVALTVAALCGAGTARVGGRRRVSPVRGALSRLRRRGDRARHLPAPRDPLRRDHRRLRRLPAARRRLGQSLRRRSSSSRQAPSASTRRSSGSSTTGTCAARCSTT